ncbi:uncharacterized protein J7T54_002877, partial [Emericellopsis cladophorae]
GATRDTFEASYRTIAETLLLPRRTDAEVNVLALVRDWLQKVDGNPFLMVIDNADNVDIHSGNVLHDDGLALYLPKCDHGKVLVTTRSRNVAEKLVGHGEWIQQVPVMEHDQALQLLYRRLGSEEESDARDLIRALDHIPLAISQAAAYIHRRRPRVTLRSYLEEFNGSQKRKRGLLRSDKGDLGRYEGVSNSVLVTWQLTFDRIREDHRRAANLLALMSQFQSQNIPESMLHGYDDTVTDSQSDQDDAGVSLNNEGSDGGSDGSEFENDLDVLRGYSLVTVKTSVETRKNTLALGHTSTLTSMANLASTYSNQGRWEEAETLFVQVMETSKTKLGADHPLTLTSMANLAATYRNQGRWEEAETLGVQVMETRKTKLGADHPSTLTSMANLASTYRDQGRWEEAETLEVQVMETSKTKLGADHPDTLSVMAHLASTYRDQGRWEEAETLEVQVMETSKTKLGADHPDTLASMANLALTYSNQGRWEEAETLEVQVMETSKTKLGADHPDTLKSMGNLASTYRNQGRWKEAEILEVQVTENFKTKLGADHPDTLKSMSNLASTYSNQGRLNEAETLEHE